MLPPEQQSQKSAPPDGRASADGESPDPESSAARKGTTGTSKRRLSDGEQSESAKDGEAGDKRAASDRQAAIRPGSQLPRSRTAAPPESQWDFDERQDARATRDNASLRRYIRWKWHRTAQHWVAYAGPSGLALVVFVLTRELGLAPQTAVKLSLACLASATAGHFSRELLTTLSGKRRSRHHRSEDDSSRSEEDLSS